VCSIDSDPNEDATQSCLDLNVLEVSSNLTEYPIKSTYTTVHVNVTLPPTLVCKHCVFQWKYRTGNSWGTSNGRSCLGCGRDNEEFFGCSDIAIEGQNSPQIAISSSSSSQSTIITDDTTTKQTTVNPTPFRTCVSAITFSQTFDLFNIMDQYCRSVCPTNCAVDKVDDNQVVYDGCVNSCNKLCTCK
jgi:hypothetical protein